MTLPRWTETVDDSYAPLAGALALLALLALMVWAITRHGRELSRHEEWQRVVNLRLDNLNKERDARRKRELQTARPPTLSDASTVRVTEELIVTHLQNPKAKKEGPS